MSITIVWFNFRTGQYDYLDNAPTDFHDYIPQIPAALGYYEISLELGKTPIEACKATLEIITKKSEEARK